MKKHTTFCFLFLFLLFCNNSAIGQSWAPVGAEWYFDADWGSSEYGVQFVKRVVTKDTFINNQSCRKIESKLFRNAGDTIDWYQYYTFDRNDSVFIYMEEEDSFFLLYDFSAEAGDTTTTIVSYGEVTTVVVDSINFFETDGSTLRKFHIRALYGGTATIIEKLGMLIDDIFPFSIYVGSPGLLRCYQDETTFINRTENACDYWNPPLSTIRLEFDAYFQLFPSPTRDFLILESKEKNLDKPSDFAIYDFTGRVVRDGKFNERQQKIDVSDLPSGVYIFEIHQQEKKFNQKFMKL